MQRGSPARCVIFLHLPKTAGTTLKGVLRHKHRRHRRDLLLLNRASDPFGGIAEVPIETRRQARVVTGHAHYGIHEQIPQPCDYITVLREPVARVVSMYRHARLHSTHRLHGIASELELEEFVRTSSDPGLGDLQTRMISGRHPGEWTGNGSSGAWTAPPLDEADLPAAKRHLDEFLVVGLTERFDETFVLIRRALGWRLSVYERRNSARAPAAPPSPDALELIRERNQLDLALYAHAEQLLDAQVATQGPSFGRELAACRILNSPGKLGTRVTSPLRTGLRSVRPR